MIFGHHRHAPQLVLRQFDAVSVDRKLCDSDVVNSGPLDLSRRDSREALDSDLKAIIAHACATEASFALSEMEQLNAEALAALTDKHNVQLRGFPGEVVAAARKTAANVLAELAGRSDMARKVHDSYAAFRDRTAAWSRVSIKAVLEAREGV